MKQRTRATVSDVARMAGVAPMTVSRVLTGSAKVADATAERVRKAVALLRYEPNELSQAFRWNRSHSIGLIVPNLMDRAVSVSVAAVNDVAKMHNYTVNLATSNDSSETENLQVKLMIQRGVEGIIIIPSEQDTHGVHYEDIEKVPFVALLHPMLGIPVDAVLAQERQGSRVAVEHLTERGHQKILFVSEGASTYVLRERLEGYRNAMLHAGLKPVECLYGDPQAVIGHFLTKQLEAAHREGITAVLTSNESATLAVIRALRALGEMKASSLCLTGFDDFPSADLLLPPVSVIRTPTVEMATLAINMLFGKIEHSELKPEGSVSLPVELLVRESSASKPGTSRSTSKR
jgi:LacI family transcriptional regulator, galactose operon repressor